MSSSLQAPHHLPDLPEDIVTAILLRLPVKSLCKFSCVSKSWLSLISGSRFVKDHIEISTKNNIYTRDRLIFGRTSISLCRHLFICPIDHPTNDGFLSTDTYYPLTVQDLLNRHEVCSDYSLQELEDLLWLPGSCNGLIFVSLYFDNSILLNPTTRKSKILPNSGTDFDCVSSISFGFGYDDTCDDYKVVELVSFEGVSVSDTLEIQVKVYSSRDNTWKTLSDWPGGDPFGGPGKYLNRAIHWRVTDYNKMEWAIISLDLASDAFNVLQLPTFEDKDVRVLVMVFEGCLALCCEHSTHTDVWLMKEYGVSESWNKVVRIPFFLNPRNHEFVRPKPLCLLADGRILLNYGTNLKIYDPRNPHIHDFSDTLDVEAITYFESLVSPDLDYGA